MSICNANKIIYTYTEQRINLSLFHLFSSCYHKQFYQLLSKENKFQDTVKMCIHYIYIQNLKHQGGWDHIGNNFIFQKYKQAKQQPCHNKTGWYHS